MSVLIVRGIIKMKWVNKMREHHYYECETCHAEYEKEENANACERSHVKPVGIEDYKTRWKAYGEYPSELVIAFENGETQTYRLKEDGWY